MKTKLIILTIVATLTFVGCKKNHYNANFTASTIQANIGQVITFSDKSDYDGGLKDNVWDFGDGTIKFTKGELEVTHSYNVVGQYTVTLTIGEKENNSEYKTIITIQ